MKKDMTQDAKSLIEKSALAADYLRRTAVLIGELRGLAAECDPEAADLPAEELPPVLRAGIADIRTGLDELRTELDTVAARFDDLMADPTLSIEGEAIDIYGDRCKDKTYSHSPLAPLDRTTPIVTNACGDESYEVPTVVFLDESMEPVDSCWDSEPGEKTIRTDNVATAAVYFIVNNWSEIEPGPVWYRHGGATLARREAAMIAAISRSLDALRNRMNELDELLIEEYVDYDDLSYRVSPIERYIETVHGDKPADMDDFAFQIKETWNPATASMSGMFANNSQLRYFPTVDTSAVTNMKAAFRECTRLSHLSGHLDTSEVTNFNSTFWNCTSLTEFPDIDLSSATDLGYMFLQCSRLRECPLYNTSNARYFNNLFHSCTALTLVPELDTSNGENFVCMFFNCISLENVPALDTSNGTFFSNMFGKCGSLREVPPIDTSAGTALDSLFAYCRRLKSIPPLDVRKTTTLRYLVRGCTDITELQPINAPLATDCEGLAMECSSLKSVGAVNLPSATNASFLFHACRALTSIESLHIPNAAKMQQLFYECRALVRAPEVDAASATGMSGIIRYCSALTHLTIRNFGQAPALTTATMDGAPNWGNGSDEARQTLVDTLLTYSFDRTAAGYDVCRISVAAAVLARLTEAEIAAITAKGFTITA